MNDAPPVYPLGLNRFGCKAYKFEVDYNFKPNITVTLTVFLRRSSLPVAPFTTLTGQVDPHAIPDGLR